MSLGHTHTQDVCSKIDMYKDGVFEVLASSLVPEANSIDDDYQIVNDDRKVLHYVYFQYRMLCVVSLSSYASNVMTVC
jgi:hypothetical protein